MPYVLPRRQTTSHGWRFGCAGTSANPNPSPTSIAASVMILAPLGETSNTKHSRFVIPLSTVIQAGCLCSCRRGSRGTFALGLSTIMMTIRRWT